MLNLIKTSGMDTYTVNEKKCLLAATLFNKNYATLSHDSSFILA